MTHACNKCLSTEGKLAYSMEGVCCININLVLLYVLGMSWCMPILTQLYVLVVCHVTLINKYIYCIIKWFWSCSILKLYFREEYPQKDFNYKEETLLQIEYIINISKK